MVIATSNKKVISKTIEIEIYTRSNIAFDEYAP